jgi:flagellar basal body-associated protein FliL
MPDLNLQDEGSTENLESSAEQGGETAESGDETPKKGGGIMTILVVVLAVLIVGGGGAFLLDKLGVIHVFSKKKAAPAVAQLQEQPAQTEVGAPEVGAGTNQMIETPPVDEKGKPSAAAKKPDEKAVRKPAVKGKAEAPVKSMPAPASSGNLQEMKGEYTVQVSAWRDKEIAGEIVRRLSDAGYPAFVEERAFNGGAWYTVRVGRYASRKDAQQAVQNFAEELRSNYWIDRARAK